MLAQICQFLAVDSTNFPSNEHIIIGDRSNQGGFLIHFFLNLCQKQNRPILFIALSQSFSHYSTVSQKLGNNLLSARDENKSLLFVDGLHLLSECNGVRLSNKTNCNPFLDLLRGNSASLLEHVRVSLEILTRAGTTDQIKSPVVIIDDLFILKSVGVAPEDLLLLVNGILKLVISSSVKGSLIILSHLDKEDEKAEELWAFLTHLSTLKIEVSDLQSGYCKDVHGQVQAEWRDDHTKPRKFVTRHTQFKLTDKSIDLFAPGMSSAVL